MNNSNEIIKFNNIIIFLFVTVMAGAKVVISIMALCSLAILVL